MNIRKVIRVSFKGNLGKDPVLVPSEDRKRNRVTFSVCENNDDGSKTWHQCVVWGGYALAAASVLAKGRFVLIEGEVNTYNGRQEVRVTRWQVLDDKRKPEHQTAASEYAGYTVEAEAPASEDIPF